MGSHEDRKRAEAAVQRYREWAQQEREAGNLDRAARLNAHADNLHRHYGDGQRHPVEYTDDSGTDTSQGSSVRTGCSLMLVGLVALPGAAWQMWELLAR